MPIARNDRRSCGIRRRNTAADLRLAQVPRLAFTPDHRFLLARSADDELLVLATADFSARRRIRPPVPEAVDPDTPTPVGWQASFIPQPGDEVIVLYAGAFTRWRLTTGELLGEPLLLRQDPTELRTLGRVSEAEARPGHPGHVFVAIPDGVELWDLDAGRRGGDAFRPHTLCALYDRPYTQGEKNLLPPGADRTPPCRLR